MISRHIHRKAVVGCGCRLLMEQLAIRLGYQKTITKSLVIAVLTCTVFTRKGQAVVVKPINRQQPRTVASALPPRPCFDCAMK